MYTCTSQPIMGSLSTLDQYTLDLLESVGEFHIDHLGTDRQFDHFIN